MEAQENSEMAYSDNSILQLSDGYEVLLGDFW